MVPNGAWTRVEGSVAADRWSPSAPMSTVLSLSATRVPSGANTRLVLVMRPGVGSRDVLGPSRRTVQLTWR